MNIAPSNTATPSNPSPAVRVDPTSAAAAASVDGVGVAASSDAAVQAFGDLLSKNIADGNAARAFGNGADSAGDAHAVALTDAVDAIKAAGAASTGALGATAGDVPGARTNRTSQDDDAADAAADPIGSDLAAQLALVSQWAGLGAQAPAASAAVPSGSPSAARDVADKPDPIRGAVRTAAEGTPLRADAATTVPATVATRPTIDTDPSQLDTAPTRAPAPAAGDPAGSVNRRLSGSGTRNTAALPGLSTAIAAALRSGGATSTDVANTAVADTVSQTAPAVDASIATAAAGPAPATTTEASLAGVLLAHDGTASVTPTASQAAAQIALQLASQVASQLVPQIASQIAQQSAVVAASTTSPATVAGATDTLREAVGTAAWSHEVGQATLRMAACDLQNVSLRLNPEHLGPMDVQMRIDNGVAHLQFTAAHLDTRQALEASRTTLHQMFNDQGIKLGDWSVGQQSANASFARDFGSARSQAGTRDGAATDDADPQGGAITTTIRTTRPLGLVDTFA